MYLRNWLNTLFLGQPANSFPVVMKELQKNPNQDLFTIQKKYGLDVATHYFYLRTLGTFKCKTFRHVIDQQKEDFSLDNQQVKLLVVGPPEAGFRKITEKFFSDMESIAYEACLKGIIPFMPKTDSVLDGAMKLKKHINELEAEKQKYILVSYSHGSAFARFAIDQIPKEQLQGMLSWVNISGLVFGSPIYNMSKPGWFNRNSSLLARSFSCEQKYFIRPVSQKVPAVVSFLGCRQSYQMHKPERNIYYDLRHWGPNDGMIAFRDYERMPGFVVPLWGQSHHIDILSEAQIFQKTLCYLVDITANADKKTWNLADLQFLNKQKRNELNL